MEREEYDLEAHWLDSDTIDGCCQTVVDMCTSDETIGTNSVLFVSSLAVSAALSRLDAPKVTQETVRRALGIVENKKMWPPRDFACFSINNGAHWSLLTYFPGYTKHRMYHYDSGRHFPGRGNASYAIKVVQMLARIRLVPNTIQLVNEIEFPVQEGGVECGYYLVAAMANLLHSRRENLNRGHVISPINSYNLDLLHRYDLTKLQEITTTTTDMNPHHPPQNVNVNVQNNQFSTSPQILRAPQQQKQQHPIRIFHKKSGISKTCSPWLVHGMYLMCQYDGWQAVCQDIFEDYSRMGLSTSSRRIASEAMRILEPRQWGSLVDVYLNPLSLKDLRFIAEKDPAIQTFMNQTILPNLNQDELSSELHKTPEMIRTALKLYLAIYLPGEISDYVNISIPTSTTPVCMETIQKIASSSISYIDLPKAPEKPPIQTLSLLMQRMMHSVGVLPSVFDEQRFLP